MLVAGLSKRMSTYDGLQEQLKMLQGQAEAFKQAEVESIWKT